MTSETKHVSERIAGSAITNASASGGTSGMTTLNDTLLRLNRSGVSAILSGRLVEIPGRSDCMSLPLSLNAGVLFTELRRTLMRICAERVPCDAKKCSNHQNNLCLLTPPY